MRASSNLLFVLVAGIGFSSPGGLGVSTESGAAHPPQVVVVGDVVDAQTDLAVAHALVVLSPVPGVRPQSARTDEHGRFLMARIAPGRYELSVTASGYLPSALGRLIPGDIGRPLDVTAAEPSVKARLYVWRAGGLAGTVLDDGGAPVARASVIAFKRLGMSSATTWQQTHRVMTDDRGEFRIGSLEPGRYAIAVPERGRMGSQDTHGATTFYPSSTTSDIASLVTVEAGQHVGGLAIALRPRTERSEIRGTLTGLPDGVAARIRLVPADVPAPTAVESQEVTAGPAGTFRLTDVPVGRYLVQAIGMPAASGAAEGATRTNGQSVIVRLPRGTPPPPWTSASTQWGEAPVTVVPSVAATVEVPMLAAPRVTGRLIFRGGDSTQVASRVAGAVIAVAAVSGKFVESVPLAAIGPDGTFQTVGLPPGLYDIGPVQTPMTWGNWVLADVTASGRRITGRHVDIGSQDVDLDLIFEPSLPSIHGRVSDNRGMPAPGATVVAFPTDRDARAALVLGVSRVRAARTSSSGEFALSDLPPGDYYLAALPRLSAVPYDDLDGLVRGATTVALTRTPADVSLRIR